MSPLEWIAVAVSLTGVWLTARRAMACWPVNIVACALYFAVFLRARLYADTVLQALFALGTLYGWAAWARGRDARGTVPVVPLAPARALAGVAAGAAGAVAIGWGFARWTDAALPWADSTLSSFSLLATWWTARRHAANWLLWIAVDAAYVGLFVVKGLLPTAGLYLLLTGLAAWGFVRWRAAAALTRPPA